MANRYWVGGTASWDNTAGTKWALTSGGAGGQAVPLATDDVFFDAASGANTVTAVTLNPIVFLSLNFTGFTGTFTGSVNISCNGNITLGSGMTWSETGLLLVNANCTFTSNGKTISSEIRIQNGDAVTLTLADDLSVSAPIQVTNGVFTANNKNVTCTNMVWGGGAIGVFNLGSGTWTLTGNLTVASLAAGANLTVNASTSTIKITGAFTADRTFNGGGRTYNNIWDAHTGAFGLIIAGSNTFADLKIDPGEIVKFTDGTTQTVTSLTCAAGAERTLTGTSTAGWTISKASGTVTVQNCDIQYSTATGGATWNAASSVNLGSNVGWIFASSRNKVLLMGV